MNSNFINVAYEEALKSNMYKKYGTVLIHKNKIISSGYNYSIKISSCNKQCILRT